MLNLVLWLAVLAGMVVLIAFAWRSAMRRRGFRLLKMLDAEGVLRYAVDVPVVFGEGRQVAATGLLAKRGTVVLTRKRLAGFAHRRRFVLVRSGSTRSGAVRAEGDWLVVRLGGKRAGGAAPPAFRFRVPDAEAWTGDAKKVLRT